MEKCDFVSISAIAPRVPLFAHIYYLNYGEVKKIYSFEEKNRAGGAEVIQFSFR